MTPLWLVCMAAIGAEHPPFEVEWFRKTPAYQRLLKEAAREDPGVPGVVLTKADVDAVLARARVTKKELTWVDKYASPLSPKRQRGRVRSVMDVLLSKSRVSLGRSFSERHASDLERVSKKYGVSVADLVSMMNAESRFGEVQGTYVRRERLRREHGVPRSCGSGGRRARRLRRARCGQQEEERRPCREARTLRPPRTSRR